jgi:hypothetical protein
MKDEIGTETALRDIVTADLQVGGVLSESLPGYEERKAQVIMARRVADALENGEHLVVEAGTGTGKSLAYLLPIVRSGKVAIVRNTSCPSTPPSSRAWATTSASTA